MRTDNKEKVLLALYGVYNLDEPDFDQVNFRRMEIPLNAFNCVPDGQRHRIYETERGT